MGTGLSGCGNMLIACELDNLSKMVAFHHLPMLSQWNLAVLHEQEIPACTQTLLCLQAVTTLQEVDKHQMHHTSGLATQGAVAWPEQRFQVTQGLKAEHYLSCPQYAYYRIHYSERVYSSQKPQHAFAADFVIGSITQVGSPASCVGSDLRLCWVSTRGQVVMLDTLPSTSYLQDVHGSFAQAAYDLDCIKCMKPNSAMG